MFSLYSARIVKVEELPSVMNRETTSIYNLPKLPDQHLKYKLVKGTPKVSEDWRSDLTSLCLGFLENTHSKTSLIGLL